MELDPVQHGSRRGLCGHALGWATTPFLRPGERQLPESSVPSGHLQIPGVVVAGWC